MTELALAVPQSLSLPLLSWAAWDGKDDMRSGGELFPAAPLPSSLRRRVTPIGRRVLEAAWTVLAGRMDCAPTLILSSRHGEYGRTLAMLRSLAESGEVSPAEFSLAVHHGLTGLLSILTANRSGHTAVAAGADSLGAALMEASAYLSETNRPVLVMHFDEAIPADYQPVGGDDEEPAAALAMLLGGKGEPVHLSWRPRPRDSRPGTGLAQALRDALTSKAGTVDAAGERMMWSVRRAA